MHEQLSPVPLHHWNHLKLSNGSNVPIGYVDGSNMYGLYIGLTRLDPAGESDVDRDRFLKVVTEAKEASRKLLERLAALDGS